MTMGTMLLDQPAAARAGLVSVEGHAYPLESAGVGARAEGGMALTTLRQQFRNPHAEALEVVYTLPLPADGAVLGYEVRVGERRIVGEVQARQAAEAAYRRALYEGRTAGLLEQDRADTFQQRLGNIPGRTPVEVEIRVLHPLAFRQVDGEARSSGAPTAHAPPRDGRGSSAEWEHPGEWEYRFPTTVGVRYVGAEGRVKDAPRIDPPRAGADLPARLTLDLRVADAVSEEAVRSPSHALRCVPTEPDARTADGPLRVAFADSSRLDRDVVVRWPAVGDVTRSPGGRDRAGKAAGAERDQPAGGRAGEAAGSEPHPAGDVVVRMVEGPGLEGDGGRYALLTVIPPAHPGATLRRDLTLLLDASGSMHGLPLTTAKGVITGLLESLDGGDRFELLAFSNSVTSLTGGLTDARPERIRSSLAALREVRASGGTEMRSALEEALRPLRDDAQRQVVLITDGYIGFEEEVVAAAARRLPAGVRIHAVGVGAAPNRTLTGGLTRAGRGSEVFAADPAGAEEAARILRNATASPVLTELEVSGEGIRGTAPARPLDVLAGHPALLTVELAPEGGRVEVAGRRAGRRAAWRWTGEVPPVDGRVPDDGSVRLGGGPRRTTLPLGALHGRELVADLELEGAAGADRREIDRAIERLALRHRIVSRRTSLVAVAVTPSVDPRAPRRRERLAVELPAGVSAEAVGLASPGALVDRANGVTTAASPSGHVVRERIGLLRYEGKPPADFEAFAEEDLAIEDGDADLDEAERSVANRPLSREPRRGPAPPRREAFDRTPAADPVEVVAEVLHRGSDLLVVEVEVPFDGFTLPDGSVRVLLDDGRQLWAELDHAASTQGEGFPRGVRVRLALRRVTGTAGASHGAEPGVWPSATRVRLRWGRWTA
jgi:Ca-activated chloride channel homolog